MSLPTSNWSNNTFFCSTSKWFKTQIRLIRGKIGREREREGERGPSLSDTLGGNLYFASENLNVLHLY